MDHNQSLDNLRGYAALSVVLMHFTAIPNDIVNKYKILCLYSYLVPGHQAVILFFILSGYVLSPSINRSDFSAIKFSIQRIFRIYPMYLISVILMLFLFKIATAAVIIRFRGIDANLPIKFDTDFFINSFVPNKLCFPHS